MGLALLLALPFWLFVGRACAQGPVQQLADQTAAWIEQTTRVPHATKHVDLVEQFSSNSSNLAYAHAAVFWPGDRMEIKQPFARALVHLAQTHGTKPWSPSSARVLLHEVLHRNVPESPLDEMIEEGATEALADDLWPAWVRTFTGRRRAPATLTAYPVFVEQVRNASERVTGQTWTSRAARLWRRSFWAASVTDRRAQLDALGIVFVDEEPVLPDPVH